MKKLVIFFTICQVTLAGTEEFCRNKWRSNERMYNHCVESQNKAQREMFRLAEQHYVSSGDRISVSADGNDKERIFNHCMNKWRKKKSQTYDYQMVNHCLVSQLDAYDIVTQFEIADSPTGKFCASKWPDDYAMREHCNNEQVKDNRKLFKLAENYGLVSGYSINVTSSGTGNEAIFYRCMTKWQKKKFETYDYPMVIYCLTN